MVVFLVGYKRLLKTMLKLLKTMFYCGTAFGFFLHHTGRIPHFPPHPTCHPSSITHPLTHQLTAPPTPHIFPTFTSNSTLIPPLSPTNPVKSTLYPTPFPHFYPTPTHKITPFLPQNHPKISHIFPHFNSKKHYFLPLIPHFCYIIN